MITDTTTINDRPSSYPGDADTVSKEQVFNMDVNRTLEYGGYY